MITASHNENGWTGLKLAKGLSSTFEPDDIADFKQLVMGGEFLSGSGPMRSPKASSTAMPKTSCARANSIGPCAW